MVDVFYSVLPIFLIAFIGSVIRRKWIKSDEFWRGLERLSFYVLFPAVLFEHTAKIEMAPSDVLRLVIALIISTFIVACALIFVNNRKEFDKRQFTSVFQGGTRYNNYILFALGAALFGEEGLTVVSTISPYMIVFTNVISVMAFVYYAPQQPGVTLSKNMIIMFKSVAANPLVLASILGFCFSYLGIKLNIGVERTIHNLADSALAIGIIIVGASLRFKINPEHFQLVFITSMAKLVLMPICTFLILWLMAIGGLAKSVGVLFSCLPCASSSYILSRQLGGDPETMSAIITFSTIFSILSLSLLVYILG